MLFETNVIAVPIIGIAALVNPSGSLGWVFGVAVAAPYAWGLYRGLTTYFAADEGGLRVRNPWRTYEFPWSDVTRLTIAQPGAIEGRADHRLPLRRTPPTPTRMCLRCLE